MRFDTETIRLEHDDKIRVKIDVRPKVEQLRSDGATSSDRINSTGQISIVRERSKLINWHTINDEILAFVRRKKYRNLLFSAETLETLITDHPHIELLCMESQMQLRDRFGRSPLNQLVVTILHSYINKFYRRKQKAWETNNLCLVVLDRHNPVWEKYQVKVVHSAVDVVKALITGITGCLLYTSPSPRDLSTSRMPSSA